VQAADKLDPTAALKKAFDRSGPTNPAPAAWTGDVSSLQINVATPDLNALINKVRSPVCTALSCLYCPLLSVPLSPVCTALCWIQSPVLFVSPGKAWYRVSSPVPKGTYSQERQRDTQRIKHF